MAMSQLLGNPAHAVALPPDLYAPIVRDLEEVERVLASTLKSRYERITGVVDHVGQYRGKRLRPALLLLIARACGRVTRAHHVLGAVVEMIHTATLVHDDVLDAATMRRHVATVNAEWGNHTSILLGDFLFTHAFHLSATLGDARACRIIGESTNRVCEGELCQGLECGNLSLGEREYLDIIDGKTAELIACCCKLGALYSEATPEVVDALTRFGRKLGMAFQIADDLLDLVGEERTTGKSLGTDLDQKKLTLPLIWLLDRSPEATSTRLRQILTAPGNHKRETLLPYLREGGALDYARAQAEQFAAQAQSELECLSPSICRTILETLADRAVHRAS
jgi:octaprenyl-diphosphate synthase